MYIFTNPWYVLAIKSGHMYTDIDRVIPAYLR